MRSQQNWPPAPPGGARSRSLSDEPTAGPSRNLVFQCLSDSTRREILRLLLERSNPASEASLARELVLSRGSGSRTLDDDVVESVRTSLRTLHLPALEEVPLVEWNRADERVRLTDHPAFEDECIQRVLATDVEVDGVFDALANERRRLVLAVLHTYGGPVDGDKVAEKVAELEADSLPGGGSVDESDVRLSLHHAHYPKLVEAGLVRQMDDERLRYVDHPEVEERWFTF